MMHAQPIPHTVEGEWPTGPILCKQCEQGVPAYALGVQGIGVFCGELCYAAWRVAQLEPKTS